MALDAWLVTSVTGPGPAGRGGEKLTFWAKTVFEVPVAVSDIA